MLVNIIRKIKISSRMFFICMNNYYNYYNYINIVKIIAMPIICISSYFVAHVYWQRKDKQGKPQHNMATPPFSRQTPYFALPPFAWIIFRSLPYRTTSKMFNTSFIKAPSRNFMVIYLMYNEKIISFLYIFLKIYMYIA